nr:hypothetical protein [Tanacetum cinerariifolium]
MLGLSISKLAWERIDKIKYVLTKPEEIPELMYKLYEDVRNIREELAEYIDSPIWNCPTFFYDEDEDTTPETELDEVTESSVKNLVPILSECEVTSKDEIECDKPAKNESSSIFTTFSNPLFDYNDDFTSSDDESLPDEDVPAEEFKIYSNPLCDEDKINSDKLDPHCFNVESDFVEFLLNQPPEDNFNLEPEVISAVMEDIDEPDEHFNLGGEIFVSTNNEDVDYFPFMFVIRIFLPYLILPEISPLLLFAESEDTILILDYPPEIEVILCWIYVWFPRSSYLLIDFSLG